MLVVEVGGMDEEGLPPMVEGMPGIMPVPVAWQ